jgi:hypothetical protein
MYVNVKVQSTTSSDFSTKGFDSLEEANAYFYTLLAQSPTDVVVSLEVIFAS